MAFLVTEEFWPDTMTWSQWHLGCRGDIMARNCGLVGYSGIEAEICGLIG